MFAQASPEDGLIGLLDYRDLGVIVFFSVALMKTWIVPRSFLDEKKVELEQAKEELRELREKLDTEVLPQLWRTTELLAHFANLSKDDKTQA